MAIAILCISIHALRMESDISIYQDNLAASLSIHALRMESDCWLSTEHGREQTFYPRSPHGERQKYVDTGICAKGISIHALRMESDQRPHIQRFVQNVFLSTLSAWRATGALIAIFDGTICISIHALRMESDYPRHCQLAGPNYFYPRSPHGERQGLVC